MDLNDFVTRHKSLEETEHHYGKNSIQYEAHKTMLNIKQLLNEGSVVNGKEFPNKFVVYKYDYYTGGSWVSKYDYDNSECTELRRRDNYSYNGVTFDQFADEVFELVWNEGYEIIKA